MKIIDLYFRNAGALGNPEQLSLKWEASSQVKFPSQSKHTENKFDRNF